MLRCGGLLGFRVEFCANDVERVLEAFLGKFIEAFRQHLGCVDGVLVIGQVVRIEIGHQNCGGAGNLEQPLPFHHQQFDFLSQQADFLVVQSVNGHDEPR